MATQTTIDVVMPQMGDSVTEGTILEWHVQEGAAVAVDDVLVEISTDKVDAEMPSPAAGTIVEILAQAGDDVTVGQVLARIAVGEGGAPAQSESNGGAPAAAEAAAGGELLDIIAPSGGESVTEATVLGWIAEQGAAVSDGDPLLEVSTDKVDMELPSPGTGVLVERLVEEGDTIVPGQLLGRVQAGAGASAASAPATSGNGSAAPAGNGSASVPEDLRISPIAARKAAAEGINLAGVTAQARQAASPSPIWMAPQAALRSAPARARRAAPPCAVARACSRSTWTSRSPCQRRPRSAPSPSRRWLAAASSSRPPARRSPSRT